MVGTKVVIGVSLALSLVLAGCGNMAYTGPAIMQAAPGDPVGSANTGTGSVTVGSTIPQEAKSAGMGVSP